MTQFYYCHTLELIESLISVTFRVLGDCYADTVLVFTVPVPQLNKSINEALRYESDDNKFAVIFNLKGVSFRMRISDLISMKSNFDNNTK